MAGRIELELNEEAAVLCEWINKNFIHRKTVNKTCTSYGLKHVFERSEHGFYITNEMFKDAMAHCGFYPECEYALSWRFCISQKSPAVRMLHSGRRCQR